MKDHDPKIHQANVTTFLSLFHPMSFTSIRLCWTCFPPVKHDSQITCIQTSYLPCKQI